MNSGARRSSAWSRAPSPTLSATGARAQVREVDLGLGREDAQRELLLAHLEREDADRLLCADRDVLRDVEREAGLAHAGPAGDDDQGAAFEAVGHPSRSTKPDGMPVSAVPGRSSSIARVSSRIRAERHEAAPDRLLAQRQDRLLGRPARTARRARRRGSRGDVAADVDQPPAHRALLDDLDVGVEPAEVGQVDVEAGEVGEAADRLERALLLELRLQRAQVDRRPGLLQLEHRA